MTVFTPTTRGQLKTAIDLWIDDNTSALSTYGEINTWDTVLITDMNNLFRDKNTFNSDISNWNTSNVLDMAGMFVSARQFNQNIGSWNTSKVENMSYMFYVAQAFNKDIGSWDTSSVNNMMGMFWYSQAFNKDISLWNTSIVTNMENMFNNAHVFNQNIQGWVVGSNTTLTTMFHAAYAMTNTYTGTLGFDETPTHEFFPGPPPTCFPSGTPVQTDQGVTAIEQLVPGEHTLRGKSIIAITQTRPLQKHIVCFEKDSIGKNVPSQQTLCSKEHKVLYRGEMNKARDLADMCKNVKRVSYNGETLYNVLLEKHGKMLVNNMICETLHPENIAAKFAKMDNKSEKRILTR